MFDPREVRKDFPILSREVNRKPLVYLDSGATSQKPQQVIDAITKYYEMHNANVHRGAHTIGDESTELLEDSRRKVASFIGSGKDGEVVFTRNTTESINLVSYGVEKILGEKPKVVVCDMDHHSNIVPWQRLVSRIDGSIEYVRVTPQGFVDMNDYRMKVKGAGLVAISHVSNALGTINDVRELCMVAKKEGAIVLIDGAQAAPHLKVDVNSINADFYAFSGHKMLGPMGAGVLYGKVELLNKMEPFMSGGGMINEVKRENTTYAEIPEKYEAGTPDVASAVGLGSAIDYLENLGMEYVRAHDREMVDLAITELSKLPELRILGPRNAIHRSGSVSFVYNGVHAHDVATILDSEGVAVRSGHHCTMILHESMGVVASVRASFNVYTTKEDIERLIEAISKVSKVMGK